jgi:hypothetical protein
MMAIKIAINGVKNSENELVAVSLIFGNIYHIVTKDFSIGICTHH